MPGKKKKFIDKKNAVTFHLVHRSQKDPLQADDEAPQRVLLPADSTQLTDSHKEEQRKFGVFFDDDYDYMQHLRDVNELNEVEPIEAFRPTGSFTKQQPKDQAENLKPAISLPATVFGSTAETDVGMLNKAAPISGPRLDWDPDIVAGLDEDFDYDNPDNQLADDFMAHANENPDEDDEYCMARDEGELFEDEDDAEVYRPVKPVQPVVFKPEIEVCGSGSDVASDDAAYSDDDSDLGSLGEKTFNDLDTRSRFTDYSMTSSVTVRNNGLTLLDDRFEKFYEQYGDEDIGALDHEEIMGGRQPDNLVLTQAIDEFERQQEQQKLRDAVKKGEKPAEEVSDDDDDDDDDDDLVKMVIRPPKEKWDCESILSTHSTLYNHPTLISEPKKKKILLTKRAGIPAEVLPTRGLTHKQIEELDHKERGDHANTYRPHGETTEERRQRKQAVKEERKIRRIEKKSNQMAFKTEEIRQQKETLNVQQNMAGMALT